MANEDPDSIPEQFRQNRPFFVVLALAILIAIGAFLYVLFADTETRDIGRNLPPGVSASEAEAGDPAPATN